jgi:hypothetical protein
MREIGAIAGYLIAWLFCDVVLGVESGLVKLLVSLLLAFVIYVLIAYAERKEEDGGS